MEQLRGCLLISAVAPGSGSDTGPEDDDDVSLATKQLLFVEEIMFTLGLKLHNDPWQGPMSPSDILPTRRRPFTPPGGSEALREICWKL